MDFNIILLLTGAFLRMASEHIVIFLEVILALLILAVPLGYLIIRYFRLFEERDISWYDRLSLALGVGAGVIILLSFFTMYIKFSATLICSEILLIDLVLLYLCHKNKTLFKSKGAGTKRTGVNGEYRSKKYLVKNEKYSALLSIFVLIFLIAMFCYYSIMPLTTDMAIFRDYDLLALGIQENSALKLPFYDIDIYYPPGMSLLTAFLNGVIPGVNIHKIMFNLSYFFMFYLFILFYQLGNIGFRNRFLGFFFMVAFAISAPPRNFVTGGATPPATTSAIFCIIFLILILRWLKDHSNKNVYAAGVLLAAGALTHFDTLLIFLWGFFALLITYALFDFKNYKKYVYVLIVVGVMSLLIIFPFLMNSYNGKKQLEKIWTDDAWENYAKDEIHPKPFSEVLFFSGRWVFYFFLLSIIYFIYLRFINNKIDKSILFIILWAAALLSTNNYIFLRIARPVFLFYAINIIMWFGTAIVFSLGAGFGFYFLLNLLLKKYDSKAVVAIFLAAVMIVAFVKIADYETYNKEDVFHRQGGFIKSAFANRNDFYNQGDIYLLEWIKHGKIDYLVVQGGFFGWAVPSIINVRPSTIFTHIFYDDPDDFGEVSLSGEFTSKIYQNKIDNFSSFGNYSYILLQSTLDTSWYSESLLESGRYDIIKRKGGAKILKPNQKNFDNPPKEKNLIHLEVEEFVNGTKKNIYSHGAMIDLATLELHKNETFMINLSEINQNESTYGLYIKHLAFVVPFSFKVSVGDKSVIIKKTSDKLTFVESWVNITNKDLAKSNFSIKISGLSEPFGFLGQDYYPEIDWVELEVISNDR